MPQLNQSNTTRLFSTAGTYGEIQIVATAGNILIDATTRNYDTAGHLHRDHALASLSLSAAARLRDLLAEAVDHANSITLDTRQTALWSDITVAAEAARFVRRVA
jgi:hypothetical protein